MTWKPDALTPRLVRRFPGIEEWLAKPDKLVTRAELWEVLARYNEGRRRIEKGNRWYRRFWRWLSSPLGERTQMKLAERLIAEAEAETRTNDPKDLRP